MPTVTAEYLEGIREGRKWWREFGIGHAPEALASLTILCRSFDASNPVGQMYRGERDFWKGQLASKDRK